ncbi:hypothetical protein [Variovorax sp. CF079]|uniref:hypothetical protein n=1 Tax=Variovorax sp. CF079 TaxID=1882774 RepID=UPI0011142048|nr:hypothetical protein [Variovorax sp. CF079]
MPSTIRYDPSLTLGAIVDPAAFATLSEIAELDAEIDAAQDILNSFISMKRSIDMTVHELIAMEVDPHDVKAKSEQIKKEISKAAADYAAIRLENEAKIRPLKAKVHSVHQGPRKPHRLRENDAQDDGNFNGFSQDGAAVLLVRAERRRNGSKLVRHQGSHRRFVQPSRRRRCDGDGERRRQPGRQAAQGAQHCRDAGDYGCLHAQEGQRSCAMVIEPTRRPGSGIRHFHQTS